LNEEKISIYLYIAMYYCHR